MTYHYKGHTKDFVLVDEGRHGRYVVEDGPVERNQCNLLNLDQIEEVEAKGGCRDTQACVKAGTCSLRTAL